MIIFIIDVFNQVVFVGRDKGNWCRFYVNENQNLVEGWEISDKVREDGWYIGKKFCVDQFDVRNMDNFKVWIESE